MKNARHTTNNQKGMVMMKFMMFFMVAFVLCVSIVAQQYVILYPKDAKNHPACATCSDCPNWYFYWIQTEANGAKGLTMVYTNRVESSHTRQTGLISIGNRASQEHRAAWGHPKGIDSFAWVTRHEAKHRRQYLHFWPNGVYDALKDYDEDGIPNDMEDTYMSGRSYDPYRRSTFKDEIGYSSNPDNWIDDWEDICMRSQTSPYGLDVLWNNGDADGEDWANPGKNAKDKY